MCAHSHDSSQFPTRGARSPACWTKSTESHGPRGARERPQGAVNPMPRRPATGTDPGTDPATGTESGTDTATETDCEFVLSGSQWAPSDQTLCTDAETEPGTGSSSN